MKVIDEIKCQNGTGFKYFCPACGFYHHVAIKPARLTGGGASWTWNNSSDKPTFTPSILSRVNFEKSDRPDLICHHFVENGRIRYLSDCTHKFAGQTIEMVDVNE